MSILLTLMLVQPASATDVFLSGAPNRVVNSVGTDAAMIPFSLTPSVTADGLVTFDGILPMLYLYALPIQGGQTITGLTLCYRTVPSGGLVHVDEGIYSTKIYQALEPGNYTTVFTDTTLLWDEAGACTTFPMNVVPTGPIYLELGVKATQLGGGKEYTVQLGGFTMTVQ